MLTISNGDLQTTIGAAQSDVAPTTQQLAALTAELALPAYAGKTDSERVLMLCQQQSTANPTPQGNVARASILSDDAYNVLMTNSTAQGVPCWQVLKAALAGASGAEAVAIQAVIDTIDRGGFLITLGDSQVAGVVQLLVPSLIPQNVADLILTQPDPAWQATIQQSRMDALGMSGLVPTARDVAAAVA